MTKSILFWWCAFVVAGVACGMVYEWLCKELPAYKTGGNADGWKPGRTGSNMRDVQSK